MVFANGFDNYRAGVSDDCELSLVDKLRASYHGRHSHRRATALSDRLGAAFFWFITVSAVYVGVVYVIPEQFADCSEWTRYCLKVACWFLFVQTIANWACVRQCDTSYRVATDG